MNTNAKNLLLILLSLFILVFFTRSVISDITALSDKKEELLTKKENITKQLERLQKIEKEFREINKLTSKSKKNSLDKAKIKDQKIIKHLWDRPTQADLIEYFHDYAEDTGDWLYIRSIDFSKPKKTEFWFLEQDINLEVNVLNKRMLKIFLNKLVSLDSKYKFYITDFSFPNNWDSSYNISIPLKLIYK